MAGNSFRKLGGWIVQGVPITLWTMVVLAIAVVIPVRAATVIMRKAGFSPWWGLLNAIPLVSLIIVWIYAFIDWPNEPAERAEDASEANSA
ncbi:MAG: hypothetical protein ACPGPC_01605 [Alphaproteobacteria bacterium]